MGGTRIPSNCNGDTHERYCVTCGYTVPITTHIGQCPECHGLEFRPRERTVDSDGNPVFGKPPNGKHWGGMTRSQHHDAVMARYNQGKNNVNEGETAKSVFERAYTSLGGSFSGRVRTNGDHLRNLCRACGTSHPMGAQGFCKCGIPLPPLKPVVGTMDSHVAIPRSLYNALIELLQETEAFRHGEGNKTLLKTASRAAMDFHDGGYLALRAAREARMAKTTNNPTNEEGVE